MIISNDVHSLYIVSDGTGETAENVVRAALHQFLGTMVVVKKVPNVVSLEQLRETMLKALSESAMVVTTLVSYEMRNAASVLSQRHSIRHIDLIGSLLGELSIHFETMPQSVPNQRFQVNDDYYNRIAAVEFTVRGDDGKNPRLLEEADLVLLGVSRTSKTPLSVFLAHKGFKVCNIPIVLDQPLPSILFEIDQERIFALTIDPETLQQIRKKRLKTMRVRSRSSYGELGNILAELDYADGLFRQNPMWPVIDVTQRAVEETASIILGILR